MLSPNAFVDICDLQPAANCTFCNFPNNTTFKAPFFLLQTDAHYYKIIGIIKLLKYRHDIDHVINDENKES